MTEPATPPSYLFEALVLKCLAGSSRPLSMSEVKAWVGRRADLGPEDRKLIRYNSGKELPAFEVAVANLISNGRGQNLTGSGLITSLERDSFIISAKGRERLQEIEILDRIVQNSLADFDWSSLD